MWNKIYTAFTIAAILTGIVMLALVLLQPTEPPEIDQSEQVCLQGDVLIQRVAGEREMAWIGRQLLCARDWRWSPITAGPGQVQLQPMPEGAFD